MATSRNSLSKNGTRTSTPHAIVLLFARRQSLKINVNKNIKGKMITKRT